MPTEHFRYGNEGEMYQLAAKVNAFCDVTADTFDPKVHVDQAKEIIEAIAPQMKASSPFRFRLRSQSKGSIFRAATEHGDVSVSESPGETKDKSLTRRNEYRTGNYVVTGRSSLFGREDELRFEHFWRRSEGSKSEDLSFTELGLVYQRKSLQPISLTQLDYKPHEASFMGRRVVSLEANPTVIWQR